MEVQTKLAIYVLCMRNSNLEIRIADSSLSVLTEKKKELTKKTVYFIMNFLLYGRMASKKI